MPSQVRRVVTGHDETGRAVVKIDETIELVPRPTGMAGKVLWSTDVFPVDNSSDEDEGQRQVRITLPNGTIFRIVEFHPGNAAMMHRTDSLDYAVVMWGEIDMELDDEVVQLKAGDVLVQRGTIHNWINRGTEPCAIAFVLIDAEPVKIGDQVLGETGVASRPAQPPAGH
jgi:quercetin dioxygenase-like cupin family protein